MNNNPIGVFDSGLGGISVLKELKLLMPHENYIYYGDNGNAPYGVKSDEEIMQYSKACTDKLLGMGAKAIVIACNTATSVAAPRLRANYTIPIIGIEPAVKPAAVNHPGTKVVVMATPVTLKKEKFVHLMENYSDMTDIIPLPCPGLVEIIERGITEGKEIDNYLKVLLSPFEKEKVSAVVLGCTHYPHIKNAIKKAFDYEVDIIDGGEGTARETKRRLAEENLLCNRSENGEIKFISSSSDCSVLSVMKKLFEL